MPLSEHKDRAGEDENEKTPRSLSGSDFHSGPSRPRKENKTLDKQKEAREILVLLSELSNKVSVLANLIDARRSLVSWLYIG